MRWLLPVLAACSTPTNDAPYETFFGDPVCSFSSIEMQSARYGGAPLFSTDPYFVVNRLESTQTLRRIDVDPPEDLPINVERQPDGRAHLTPLQPLTPGSRLQLDEGYGCPVWEGSVHPAGLPVDPADLHGRTWVLRDPPSWYILTTPGPGDDMPAVTWFPDPVTAGPWPLFLHAEVDGPQITWSVAGGAVDNGGAPDPCALPSTLSAPAPFDPDQPGVTLTSSSSIAIAGAPWSLTFFQPTITFTPAPGGASIGLLRLVGAVDAWELLSAILGEHVGSPSDFDVCDSVPIAIPADAPPSPCFPCEGTPSGFCTDRALIILDAPAVDVPWPTEASIAANPACLAGG